MTATGDPHSGTDLVGGHCPICGWSPDDKPADQQKHAAG